MTSSVRLRRVILGAACLSAIAAAAQAACPPNFVCAPAGPPRADVGRSTQVGPTQTRVPQPAPERMQPPYSRQPHDHASSDHDRDRRHPPRQIFVLGGALGSVLVPDWAARGLAAPAVGTVWARSGDTYLLLDNATGDVLQQVRAPGLAPLQLFNVGIAWSEAGTWATRVAPTLPQARAAALSACASFGRNCSDSGLSLSDAGFGCFAIVGSGTRLYGAVEGNLQTALTMAGERCGAEGNAGCTLQIANCNDHA